MSMPSCSATSRVWWHSPAVVVLILVPAAILPTIMLSDTEFRYQWATPKSITESTCALLAAGGLLLVLGAIMHRALPPHARPGRWPALSAAEIRTLRRASPVLLWLTLIGYAAFVVLAVKAGVTPSDLGGKGEVRETIGTAPGLTTLTQAGIASAVVSAFLMISAPRRKDKLRLALVLGLASTRAFVLAERLALLEIALPVAVILTAHLAGDVKRRRYAIWLPAVAAPLVVVLFAIFEYFRSWTFYRTRVDSSFIQFAVERIAGYYATALNNGQLNLSYASRPGDLPYDTVGALWNAPGIKGMHLYEQLTGWSNLNRPQLEFDALRFYGNPEFNNSTGLAAPFLDYGIFGGLVFFLALGVALGGLYRGFRDGRPYGMMLYPVFFTGLVDLPRVFVWGEGRFMPGFIALVAVAIFVTRSGSHGPGIDEHNGAPRLQRAPAKA